MRSQTSYGTWSRRTRRSSVSRGSQKCGTTIYFSVSFLGGNTSTNHQDVTFGEYKLDKNQTETAFKNFGFTNSRAITRSMLAWWAFTDENQPFLPLDTVLEIEHIYAKNRFEKENSLKNAKNIESLGNKALLEKRINIRASDYRFADKIKYYNGYTNAKGQVKEGTRIKELKDLAVSMNDFTETDIISRHDSIIDGFMQFLSDENLLK